MKLYKNFDTQMKKLLSVAALAGAVLLCSCGGNKTLKMGSLSKFDSLSYALGANIGYGMQYEMSDIPFNFEEVNKGIKEGALDKSKQKHEDAIDILRDYFMNKRGRTRLRHPAEEGDAGCCRRRFDGYAERHASRCGADVPHAGRVRLGVVRFR